MQVCPAYVHVTVLLPGVHVLKIDVAGAHRTAKDFYTHNSMGRHSSV
jgi:hypothetical protein